LPSGGSRLAAWAYDLTFCRISSVSMVHKKRAAFCQPRPVLN
jgi:hypothetical protein